MRVRVAEISRRHEGKKIHTQPEIKTSADGHAVVKNPLALRPTKAPM
jgi:hypothetical protein